MGIDKQGTMGTGEERKVLTDGNEEGHGQVEWTWHPGLKASRQKYFL
jgi:hypothetical protein